MLPLVLCFFTFVNAQLQPISLPVYIPPSQETILKKYFLSETNSTNLKDGMNNTTNITTPIRDTGKDVSPVGQTPVSSSKAVNDIVWTGLLKNLLRNAYETTTYRYPTATWTAEQHEKLKEHRKNYLRKVPKVFLMKPTLSVKSTLRDEKPIAKPQRGKVKWKDTRQKLRSKAAYRGLGKEEVDRFLEQSLFRYLVSSNLIDNIGNVPVETFSEILRNITRQKADKRQFWPYSENRDLRIKFRDEVFMRRKPEVPPRGKFLEKQFQKRLERMKDYLISKDRLWRNRNTVDIKENVTTTESLPTAATSVSTTSSTQIVPTTVWSVVNNAETFSSQEPKLGRENNTEVNTLKPEFEELKLSVAETVYYKKRPFPPRMFSYEEEETNVIPGVPEIDYPMYSSPPTTGFKCPKDIGEQPRMMADTQTRCQVFYVCTGDGPAAAMLCPNGTMFNENVRVCDWWYNVDC